MSGTTVGAVGEFGLIDLIQRALPASVRTHSTLRIGIGDDTAVWQPSPGEQVLITTDALVEGIHFDRSWQDWESLGWKSLAVNISDIAAMGGRPALATITLGLQAECLVDDILAFYRGAARLAVASGLLIAGGDIVRSPNRLSIGVTVLGETRQGRVLTRSGAQPGDLIAVSGTLGAAAAGLRLLQLPADAPRRRSATAPALIDALLEPQPRVALGELLLAAGATAAMDLSDGLLGDLPKILAASAVTAELRVTDLPVAAAVRTLFPDEWQALALRGGEDYELLFTIAADALPGLQEEATRIGQAITVIGEVMPTQVDVSTLTLVDQSGSSFEPDAGAFDHFRG